MNALLETLGPADPDRVLAQSLTPVGCPDTLPSSWTGTAAGPPTPSAAGSRTQGRCRAGARDGGNLPAPGHPALTLYAFSGGEWKRPRGEVDTLWRLLRIYLRRELPSLMRNRVRLIAIGRLDALPNPPCRNAGTRRVHRLQSRIAGEPWPSTTRARGTRHAFKRPASTGPAPTAAWTG